MDLKDSSTFFGLHGIICNKENAKEKHGYQQGKSKSGKDYRKIDFMVKTSNDNKIPVELFGMVQEKVTAYNKKTKEKMSVLWSKRMAPNLPDGFSVIDPDYDRIDNINKGFRNGDRVYIKGRMKIDEYIKEGVCYKTTKYNINSVEDSADFNLDFDSIDFIEDSTFSCEIIFNGLTKDDKEGKLFISGIVISNKKPYVVDFVVNINKNKEFATDWTKIKIGDFIKIKGIINNRVKYSDEEVPLENNSPFKNTGAVRTGNRKVITGDDKSLEITGIYAETYIAQMVSETEILQMLNEEKEIQKTGKSILDKVDKIAEEKGVDLKEKNQGVPFSDIYGDDDEDADFGDLNL